MTSKTKPVAFITGASRGIGKAIAEKLARNNFRLALLSRSKSNLQEVANSLDLESSDVLVLDCDITDANSVKNSVQKAKDHFGSIDAAMVNHGVYEKSFFNTKPGDWHKVLNVNLISAMQVTEYLLPHLTASQSEYKSLIYTASVASHMRYAGGAAYCTSKHGLLGFAHCIFDEVRETGLKVCAVCPGFVNTDMINKDSVDATKTIQPEDIAEIIFNTICLNHTVCPVEIIVRPQANPYKS